MATLRVDLPNDNIVRALEKAVNELESTVRRVESVSTVFDFDTKALKESLRISPVGVSKLAVEVGEELRAWHRLKEYEIERQNEDLVQRLRDTVDQRNQEETDRRQVRKLIRQHLLDRASGALSRGEDLCFSKRLEMQTGGPNFSRKSVDVPETAGSKALAQLKNRLELVLAPLEALRPDRPEEMGTALDLVSQALARKRGRAPDQRKRLLDATGNVDAELLHEADLTSATRRVALAEQGERQTEVMRCLKEAQVERIKLFEELDDSMREGPPPLPSNAWAGLWPMTVGSRRTAVVDRANPHEAIRRQVMARGGERTQKLVEQFQAEHLQSQLSDAAMDADAELEVWKLRTQQDLLDAARATADACHNGVLDKLKSSIAVQEESPLEQLTGAVKVTEDYQKAKLAIISEQCHFAESTMQQACNNGLSKARARRRKMELATSKRWADTKEYLNSVASAVDAHSILQAGEAAQRCVAESHSVLRLPSAIRELHSVEKPEVIKHLNTNWDCYETPMEDKLDFLSEVLKRMPDSPESCAVLHGVLSLIDEAMRLQIGRLQHQTERFRGTFVFSGEQDTQSETKDL